MQTIEDWLSQLGLSKYMETDLGYRDAAQIERAGAYRFRKGARVHDLSNETVFSDIGTKRTCRSILAMSVVG